MSNGDPHRIEGLRARPPKGGFPWLRATLFVGVLGAVVLPFTPPGGKILRGLKRLAEGPPPAAPAIDKADLERQLEARLRGEFEADLERELAALKKQLAEATKRDAAKASEPEPPSPLSSHTAATGGDVRTLRSGIPFKTEVKVDKGGIASQEREAADSYTASYTLSVRVPEPSRTLSELHRVNPRLAGLLPGLPALMEKPEVSRWFFALYDNKTTRLKRDAPRPPELLTQHNFSDCATIPPLPPPPTPPPRPSPAPPPRRWRVAPSAARGCVSAGSGPGGRASAGSPAGGAGAADGRRSAAAWPRPEGRTGPC